MIDAQNYVADERLKDRTPVTIRAIRGDDKHRILAAFKDLDRESIYTRFFAYKKALTDTELADITEVDFDHVVALVVTTGAGEEEKLIGGGRFYSDINLHGSRCAELAFLTADDYRGRGVAGLVLRHLIRIAPHKGVSRFEADVLAQNKAMLRVFRQAGLSMDVLPEGSVLHVTLVLKASLPPST